MEPPHINIIVVYPVEFIGDPVLEENIPKMLSVVREYIKEYESYLTFKTKIGNTVWDSEKLKYGNIAYEHQERADKLAEKMNEGISPYFWYVGKVSENVVFNAISRKVDYAVCLEKMIWEIRRTRVKINRIKDFESFFKVVDKCKGRVDIVSPEGDNIVLNSQLCRFVLTALVQSGDTLLDTLELHCENPDDAALFIKYMMEE